MLEDQGRECGGGWGEHSWTELFVSNSLAPECSDPLCRVCELAASSENRGNTPVQLFSTSQSLAAVSDQLPSAPTFPSSLTHTPYTHTKPRSLCLSHPLFFSFHYIFISLSWERAPPHWWKGGWLKAPGGENISTPRANFTKDGGAELQQARYKRRGPKNDNRTWRSFTVGQTTVPSVCGSNTQTVR